MEDNTDRFMICAAVIELVIILMYWFIFFFKKKIWVSVRNACSGISAELNTVCCWHCHYALSQLGRLEPDGWKRPKLHSTFCLLVRIIIQAIIAFNRLFIIIKITMMCKKITKLGKTWFVNCIFPYSVQNLSVWTNELKKSKNKPILLARHTDFGTWPEAAEECQQWGVS